MCVLFTPPSFYLFLVGHDSQSRKNVSGENILLASYHTCTPSLPPSSPSPYSPSFPLYKKQQEKNEMLTMNQLTTDPHSPQPSRTYRSTHNGRQRSSRSNPLLRPIWHLPPIQRKSPFRLYLWSRLNRFPELTHHLLTNVSSSGPVFFPHRPPDASDASTTIVI